MKKDILSARRSRLLRRKASPSTKLGTGALALLLLCCAPQARADFLDAVLGEQNTPIVRHEPLGGTPLFKEKRLYQYGHIFNFEDTKPAEGTEEALYPALPECAGSRVRREPVTTASWNTYALDYLFYDGRNENDAAAAKRVTTISVGYIGGKGELPPDQMTADLQQFALILNVTCLPTRFHFVTEGKEKIFMEYREGDAAWDEVKRDEGFAR